MIYGHLWFLLYSFVFSLTGLPVFTTVHRRHGDAVSKWLAKVASTPGALPSSPSVHPPL
jgi:hypothetical protein